MLQNFFDLILEPTLNGSGWLHIISTIVTFLVIFAAALITYYVVRCVIKIITSRLLKIEKSFFLRILARNKTLHMFAHIAAGVVVWLGSQLISEHNNTYTHYESLILAKVSLLYIFIICLIITSRMIWSINSYYERQFDFARQYPIYSYLKVAILFVWVVGLVLIVSFFLNTSPWALLTGVGAISAVFLLVFKDTLLGIISSIQATALNIVRIGDRIILDKYAVDGRVLDISINTVRVKNSDNTIATIPTYMLTTEVIKNWSNVEETGSRLIKRAVFLDPDSVVACDAAMLEQLDKLPAVNRYISAYPSNEFINLSLFRAYFQDFLNRYKSINHDELSVIRHLDPISIGALPLEVLAYANTAATVEYEDIQAEIFEHLYSMLPVFNLKIYRQN